jgi:hypothetical protein
MLEIKKIKIYPFNSFPEGEWDGEFDKYQLITNELFDALIIRTGLGHLCGYVGLPENHAYYKVNYNKLQHISVHGGLTFSDFSYETKVEPSVSHLILEKSVWWLGFDCCHWCDSSPINYYNFKDASYRNVDYVKNEIFSLSKQLQVKK